MNLLELQQRANVLVNKVNLYEASLTGTELDENQVLNQHTYVDIFCLRPVLKLLFGKTLSDKLSRTLENDIELPLVSSTAPAWNTFFNFFNQEVTSNQHEFIQNIDTYNSSNMLMLDTQQYTLTDRDTAISLGIRYSYGANIGDALVTESQVSNLFNWNTTNDTVVRNNTQTTNRQVPGIVLYYLGNDYNGVYTATIPYSRVLSNINTVNDSNPPLYGAYYDSSDTTKSQVGLDMGAECCRIFVPGCNYLGGKLISPQQIWQPDRKVGDDNIGYGYNWQGKAIYHELVFKNRRSGCSNNGVDFIPGLDTIPDNDPQGLATRIVLAQMKNYYYNRPWFNELNTYRSNPNGSTNLADAIHEAAKKNIYENQLADFIAVNNNPIINLDTGEYTTKSVSDYISVSKTNSILTDGIIDFDISFTIFSDPGLCLVDCPSCFSIVNSDGYQTKIYIRDATRRVQAEFDYTIDKEYTMRVHIDRSTNELTFYKRNDLSEWDSLVSFTEPNFGDLILGSDTETWYLNSNAVIHLKSCKFTKDNVEYPFLDRVNVGTEPMTDDEFYNNYKLDYDTFADAFGFSK